MTAMPATTPAAMTGTIGNPASLPPSSGVGTVPVMVLVTSKPLVPAFLVEVVYPSISAVWTV